MIWRDAKFFGLICDFGMCWLIFWIRLFYTKYNCSLLNRVMVILERTQSREFRGCLCRLIGIVSYIHWAENRFLFVDYYAKKKSITAKYDLLYVLENNLFLCSKYPINFSELRHKYDLKKQSYSVFSKVSSLTVKTVSWLLSVINMIQNVIRRRFLSVEGGVK